MLTDVLLTQQRELEQRFKEPYIERELLNPIRDNDLIKVVSGPRRAGKSFFAMHWLHSLGPFGYANFDDERLSDLTDYDQLVAALDSVYGNPRRLLLDEIQNLPKWELFANRLQRQGRRLVLTGSNAHLLSSELATHLTGRHETLVLLPFSFAERLQCLQTQLTEPERAAALRRYLEEGGLPEPALKDMDRRAYLTALWDSVIYKDIVKRHRIRSVQGIEDLARYLLSNLTSEYASRTLSAVTRCRSVHTVEKYLRHLEEAFLVFPLTRFSFKVKEQARANRKVYCIDNGFATAKGFQFSPNVGKLCENLVAVALKRLELAGRAEIYFWKSPQQEVVDFVVKRGADVTQLIQVCWNLEAPQMKTREVRALLKASRELRCQDLLILTESTEAEDTAEWFGMKGRVRYVPLRKWLLEDLA
jgi:predicted AAA+ superfamily ATPase